MTVGEVEDCNAPVPPFENIQPWPRLLNIDPVTVIAVEDAYGRVEAMDVEVPTAYENMTGFVDVAGLEDPPEPQAEALAEIVPSAPNWAQRVPEPPAEDTIRFVVEAYPVLIAVVEA